LALCSLTYLSAQTTDDILEAYENYTEAPRELAYVHLNKSTYIEGEIMGFTAYLFDKFTKEPSKTTTNLYCTISDKEGKVLRKKLVRVENGIASNGFNIDSTLSTGIFTFKVYTNWMRNFEEQNHFEQTFKVIDADNLELIKPVSANDIKIDLQILGEGGHIVYDIPNSVGIIAKNQFGYGIANAFGSIINNHGGIVSEFQLNSAGMAKALFTPKTDETYTAILSVNEQAVSRAIEGIKPIGMTMRLQQTKIKTSILLRTNLQTLNQIKDKTFKIALHNGSEVIVNPIELNEEGELVVSFPNENLFSGINIFTVFNSDNKPLLERLYFNKQGIAHQKVQNVAVDMQKDSLQIALSFASVDVSQWSNLSVSVLPAATQSYNHNNTLLTQLYIQPYVKGAIENGHQYFENNDVETNYNIDMLMLTQGWSSYDWDAIFNKNERKYIFPFERGIDVVANINKDKQGSYLLYPLDGSETQLFDVPKKEKAFTLKTLFPNENDLLRIGYIDTEKSQFKENPSLYLQFYPSEFADFVQSTAVIEETFTLNETSFNSLQSVSAWDNAKVQQLEEVVVETEKNYSRAEALANKAVNSRVDIMTDVIKYRNQRIDLYLERLGWVTEYDYSTGRLSITNPRVNWGDPVPLVYLDNQLLTTTGSSSDFSILSFLNTGDVDYIEYEWYGTGGGVRGNAGFIKIVTAPRRYSKTRGNLVSTYDVPLRFSKQKSFYTPKYQYYNTPFFNQYGTIDWLPNLSINSNGKINFKIADTKTNTVTLFIEGIINENQYISQEIKIKREN
jgi:hypothetical protein